MGKAIATGTGQEDGSDISSPLGDSNRSRASGAPRATPSAPQPEQVPPSAGARSAPSKPQGGTKSFEFVLVTDSESRKQVRRHAMRQYMRQRRLDGIARLESSRAQVRSWNAGNTPASATLLSPSSSRIESLDENEKTVDTKNGPSDWSRDRVVPTELDTPKLEDDENMTNDTDEHIYTCLQEIHSSNLNVVPGSGCLDPFSSYPLKLTRPDQNLIHHFVTTYPMMMYKMGDAYQDNPIKGIFHHLTLHDPVPFQAMLAISSKHLAGAAGRNESVQSLTHKMRALRLLNERLQSDVGGKYDGTIYAAATMAVIEKWSKDPAVERMHHQGIRQIVRRRGGMCGVRASSPFLESVLYWVDFSSAPRAIVGASLPWTGDIPDTVPSSLSYLSSELHIPLTPFHHSMGADPEEISSALRACEDFLTFFRSLDELQHSLISSAVPPSQSFHHQGQDFQRPRLNLFDPSTPLYSILTTLPDYDHGIRDIRFIDEYSCMACLLYLNIALYDFYFTSRNFDQYIEWVTIELKKINPHSTPSISSLLWVFLGHGGYMASESADKGERSWFVSRMLRVAKKLEWKRGGTSWDNLRSTLLGFLTTHVECGIGRYQITEVETLARQNRPSLRWDEDEMRRDILGPLYTGPPVFSMAPNTENINYTLLPLTAPDYVPSSLKL
ncbi:hypothetical protein ACJ73_00599 [Blastomyces percursus]|uniref:Transcription factor domain-containing protein n=1 Tax=Blastomyces percursus TaxID=1658174 RepID=A0A1J9QHN6_9EURO|nr:hypothetical protein ACJ73_00599 [Blastomyces percursus]